MQHASLQVTGTRYTVGTLNITVSGCMLVDGYVSMLSSSFTIPLDSSGFVKCALV